MVDAQCGPKTGGVCLCTVGAIPPAVMDQVGNPERLESSPVTASEETPGRGKPPAYDVLLGMGIGRDSPSLLKVRLLQTQSGYEVLVSKAPIAKRHLKDICPLKVGPLLGELIPSGGVANERTAT